VRKKRANLTVAVIGFGSQGKAQAQRLRAGGFDVVVGLRPGSRRGREARRLKFRVQSPNEAAWNASAVAMLVPDRVGRRLLAQLSGRLRPDALVVFAAGYPLAFGSPALPRTHDVVLVAPHGPGSDLAPGRPMSGFVGVAVDATGHAARRARNYARAIGLSPLFVTSVEAEAHGDLFGEQALLCGGLVALTSAVAEVMLERGLPPANAYFETVAQLDRLAALLKERGVRGFYSEISDCAAYGMAEAGPRLVDARFKRELERVWERIASGRFARAFQKRGRPPGLPREFGVLLRLERSAIKKGRPRATP
jgi:ketol-acid reductoisomerase